MYMTMTIVRPGLFFQRERPGSEPGKSLLCPDEAPRSAYRVLEMDQCRASLLHKQKKQVRAPKPPTPRPEVRLGLARRGRPSALGV